MCAIEAHAIDTATNGKAGEFGEMLNGFNEIPETQVTKVLLSYTDVEFGKLRKLL